MMKDKFNKELFESICTEIATSSKGLKDICDKHGVSSVSFYAWLQKDKDLLNTYTRAREEQAEFLADEIVKIADDNTRDTIVTDKGIEVEDKEWTNRSKLRVEARKWVAAKLKPKKYGDKIEVDAKIDATVTTITGMEIK